MKLGYRTKYQGNVTIVGDGELGGKGEGLRRIAILLDSCPVARIPITTILTTEVTENLGTDTAEMVGLLEKLDLRHRFIAVRSSSTCEDGKKSYAGMFDTKFVKNDNDPIPLVCAINEVVGSHENVKKAHHSLGKNAENAKMALILQSVVGGKVSDEFYGPLFSGVLDTSSVNGDGTMTLSVALGLGTVAVSSTKSANMIVSSKGHFKKGRDFTVMPNQTHGRLLNYSDGKQVSIPSKDLLNFFKFSSMEEALSRFIDRYMVPLYTLSVGIGRIFDPMPIDVEFSITPTRGNRLYLLQARQSHMQRKMNRIYPQIPEERCISRSRSVLGAKTVETELMAYFSSKEYLHDAENGFQSLKQLDSLGKQYILIIPPEATSSEHPNIPLAELKNLVFVVENLKDDEVHVPSVSGVDHFSRLANETDIGYLESWVDFDRIRANSTSDLSLNHLPVYKGSFGAAVCGETKRGVLYLNQK